MTDKKKTEELDEAELDQVTGGVGLLLPAVQSAREAASTDGGGTKTGKEFLSSGHTTGIEGDDKAFQSSGGGSPTV